MSRVRVFIAVVLATFLVPVLAQTLFLWGTVKWTTGSPAAALRVSLLSSNGTVHATTYTNQRGRYAFFGVSGKPADYSLQVDQRDAKRAEVQLNAVTVGGRVDEIVVTP